VCDVEQRARVLFVTDAFFVTLALKTVSPNPEHSFPSNNRNFSNGRQFIRLGSDLLLSRFLL
jgi:hypothetical protein